MASLEEISNSTNKNLQFNFLSSGIKLFDSNKLIIKEGSSEQQAVVPGVIPTADSDLKEKEGIVLLPEKKAVAAVDSIVDKLVNALDLENGKSDITTTTTPPTVGSNNITNATLLLGTFSSCDSTQKPPLQTISSRSSLAGTMFSDVFDGKGGELESTPLEDSCALGGDGMDKNCKICT